LKGSPKTPRSIIASRKEKKYKASTSLNVHEASFHKIWENGLNSKDMTATASRYW